MNSERQEAAVFRAVYDTEKFFRRHGAGLLELLDVFGGEPGVDLFCMTAQRLDCLDSDPVEIALALREIIRILEKAENQDDRYTAPLSWYGARLSDLVFRFRDT